MDALTMEPHNQLQWAGCRRRNEGDDGISNLKLEISEVKAEKTRSQNPHPSKNEGLRHPQDQLLLPKQHGAEGGRRLRHPPLWTGGRVRHPPEKSSRLGSGRPLHRQGQQQRQKQIPRRKRRFVGMTAKG
jgi:hypothetical protein